MNQRQAIGTGRRRGDMVVGRHGRSASEQRMAAPEFGWFARNELNQPNVNHTVVCS